MTDTKALTALLQDIIARGDAKAARNLVCSKAPDRDAWLPEALMAFNTPGLSLQQKREMIKAVFPGAKNIKELADCNARLGRLGFSFPIWRFLAQSFNQATLIEQFGMTKLKRDTDIGDPSLPNPARDLFGTGFILRNDEHYIEYRRAYIVCADETAAIVIRNNSYFFGRNRLPAPVYISFAPMKDLENLKLEDFNRMTRWQDIVPSTGKIRRIEKLLNTLDNFDMQLSDWLKQEGRKSLTGFLSAVNGPLPFLGIIDKDMPPWYPKVVLPVTPQLLSALKTDLLDRPQISELKQIFNASGKEKLVLLSGRKGDLPLPQAKP